MVPAGSSRTPHFWKVRPRISPQVLLILELCIPIPNANPIGITSCVIKYHCSMRRCYLKRKKQLSTNQHALNEKETHRRLGHCKQIGLSPSNKSPMAKSTWKSPCCFGQTLACVATESLGFQNAQFSTPALGTSQGSCD